MPKTLFKNSKTVPCYAIFNNCSSCYYVLKRAADTLQCKPSRTIDIAFVVLSVRALFRQIWFNYTVDLSTLLHAMFTLQSVYSVETLIFDLIDAAKLNNVCSRYDHLRHITFPNLVDTSVHISLGVDAFWYIAERKNLKGSAGSSYGVELAGMDDNRPVSSKVCR